MFERENKHNYIYIFFIDQQTSRAGGVGDVIVMAAVTLTRVAAVLTVAVGNNRITVTVHGTRVSQDACYK